MLTYGGAALYLTGWPRGPEFVYKLARKWDQSYIHVASLQQFRESKGRCRFVGVYRELTLAPALPVPPVEAAPPAPTQPPKPLEVPAAASAVRVQEAPPKASLDAKEEEPSQWGGGPKINPYAHLPPYQRPPEYRY